MKITILAIGQLKSGPELSLIQEYRKRLHWPLILREIVCKKDLRGPALKQAETELLLDHIPKKSIVMTLDERGKALKSQEFAKLLANYQTSSQADICFIIGGADGLADVIRQKAQHVLSFGQLTWPHMLVRVMLLEQLYRAQQIIAGHPYHRD
jgi:23S rRNA (pseudouridine1915-N3)-methyltransferase